MGENERIEDEIGFIGCPFCEGRINVSSTDDEGRPAMLHTMPPCRTYLDTEDALAFVKVCNLEVARRRGVGLT